MSPGRGGRRFADRGGFLAIWNQKGFKDDNNERPHLVHMWWEVMFVGGRNAVAQLKFSGDKLCSIYDPVHGQE